MCNFEQTFIWFKLILIMALDKVCAVCTTLIVVNVFLWFMPSYISSGRVLEEYAHKYGENDNF